MMRPTLRGIGAILAIVAAAALAWLFGERSLNAIAAPALVALLTAVVQLLVASEPTVEREPLTPGFPGETRSVSLAIEGGTTVVDVTDEVPRALTAEGNDRSVSPPTTMTYDLRYDTRGEHIVGPTTVRVRDVFGLFDREVTFDTETSVLIYPRVYTLAEGGELSRLVTRARSAERDEFEDLREYVPGDPLRDVHWKSTAKRPDELMVKEFGGRQPEGTLAIAVTSPRATIDEAAAATASIAVALLAAGLVVDVHTPGGSVTGVTDAEDRRDVLTLLARTGHGRVDDEAWASADIAIMGKPNGSVDVRVDGRTTSFDDWRTGGENPLRDRVNADAGSARGDRTVVSAQ